jgi:hypothetical protein
MHDEPLTPVPPPTRLKRIENHFWWCLFLLIVLAFAADIWDRNRATFETKLLREMIRYPNLWRPQPLIGDFLQLHGLFKSFSPTAATFWAFGMIVTRPPRWIVGFTGLLLTSLTCSAMLLIWFHPLMVHYIANSIFYFPMATITTLVILTLRNWVSPLPRRVVEDTDD